VFQAFLWGARTCRGAPPPDFIRNRKKIFVFGYFPGRGTTWDVISFRGAGQAGTAKAKSKLGAKSMVGHKATQRPISVGLLHFLVVVVAFTSFPFFLDSKRRWQGLILEKKGKRQRGRLKC
jgi:hypothetical protein